MVCQSPTNADIAPASLWRDADSYAYVRTLPPAGCAWEFLRRNPEYQKAWRNFRSKANPSLEETSAAATFGLLRFETPERDARSANVFWHRSICRDVLPVVATKREPADRRLKLSFGRLQCRMTVHRSRPGELHILFAEDGRFLQLEVRGLPTIGSANLTTEIVLPPRLLFARVQSVKRFADLVATSHLRPCLYPPERRASRWLRALQAFDAARTGASQKQIAASLFGETIVKEDWSGRSDYLRLRTQRLLRLANRLVHGGYRDFLR